MALCSWRTRTCLSALLRGLGSTSQTSRRSTAGAKRDILIIPRWNCRRPELVIKGWRGPPLISFREATMAEKKKLSQMTGVWRDARDLVWSHRHRLALGMGL